MIDRIMCADRNPAAGLWVKRLQAGRQRLNFGVQLRIADALIGAFGGAVPRPYARCAVKETDRIHGFSASVRFAVFWLARQRPNRIRIKRAIAQISFGIALDQAVALAYGQRCRDRRAATKGNSRIAFDNDVSKSWFFDCFLSSNTLPPGFQSISQSG